MLSAILLGLFLTAGDNHTETDVTNVILSMGITEEAATIDDGVAGYIEDDIVLPVVEEEGAESADIQTVTQHKMSGTAADAKVASSLPSSYDARTQGRVTSVKNQESDNTCWAYSAASVAESSMISQGKADATIDLSEEHLAYYFYHTNSDPLGNTTGDTTLPVGGDYLSVGGNYIFTTFALANWVGIADESMENEMDWDADAPGTYSTTDLVHLQNAYWVNLKANPSHVKRLILSNGSVGTSMWFSNTFYNSTTYSYYNNLYSRVNHAVTIVGWDDHYSKANFKTQPVNDGAWLIKNSYGDEWGNGGYFWVSYEDAALTQDSAKAYAFFFEEADNYDYNYQYDGTAAADINADTGYRVASGDAIANIYTVPKDAKTKYQTIKAVSFALYATNVNYSVQIYRNLSDITDPTSGTAILDVPVTGSTSYVGYYTVPVEMDAVLSGGDTFSVVVTLNKDNGADISYFVDKTYQNGSWVAFHNTTAPNQSFVYSAGGWGDLAASGVSARIKAFTDDYVVPAETISLSDDTIQLWKGQTVSMSAEVLPTNTSYPHVNWTSLDEKVPTISKEGRITALKAGSTMITASVQGSEGIAASCLVTVRQQADAVKVAQKHYYMKAGGKLTVELVLSPRSAQATSLRWESSDDTVASIDEKGVIHSISNGTTTISIYSAVSGERLASMKLTVNETGLAPTNAQISGKTDVTGETANTAQTPTTTDTVKVTGLPLTGDENALGLWGVLMAIGILVIRKTCKVLRVTQHN